jgi:exosortase E/protease (VPEID-CTERM system)
VGSPSLPLSSACATVRVEVQSGGSVSNPLARRLLILVLALGSQALVAAGASFAHEGGVLTGWLRDWGAWVLRWVMGFAALYATFVYIKHQTALANISEQIAQTPIRRGLFAAYGAAIGVFGALSTALYRGGFGPLSPDLIAMAWIVTGVAAVAFAGLALAPWAWWVKLAYSTGNWRVHAAAAAVAACLASVMNWAPWEPSAWEPPARLTFHLVRLLLSPLVPELVLQPTAMRIGTNRFTVIISPGCSGLVGVALLLVFGALYLWLFWKESRFPHSLLLLAAGVVVLFLLNALRIAVLILIGHAGAREIAIGGFHEQAGWIAFTCVAFGFSIAARNLPWFSAQAPEPEAFRERTENPTSTYLLPLLMILVAGMVSRAASGSFEWLYALRFFAALGALWLFRQRYREFDWKFAWSALASGTGVFVLWVALDRMTGTVQGAGLMPAALASASPGARTAWITLRVLAAVITVPLAEELAFRGFLLRRFISAHFETVSLQTFTLVSLLASSIIFGLLHGERWLAGAAAGVAYGLAAQRRGRLTDAVMAHATTNALLAAYVLVFQKWYFW